MRISAKGEYAILAVLDLALAPAHELVPIQDIAARQGIPQRYLEQVLLSLKRAGILGSKRGSSGGYQLARPPEQVSVGDVLRAVEGVQSPVEAQRRPAGRDGVDSFDLAELWGEISTAVSEVVDRISFGELAERARARRSAARPMYHI